MSEAEVALRLMDIIRSLNPGLPSDKEALLALYRECLAAVRGKAE